MHIVPIEFSMEVEALLTTEELPSFDLMNSYNVKLFGFESDDNLAGIIGIELYENIGLLRSLVVRSDLRNTGNGKALVAKAESWALKNDISHLYLLTTSAVEFFTKLNYELTQRDKAPLSIASTSQFSSLCPSSAIFMHKDLIAEELINK